MVRLPYITARFEMPPPPVDDGPRLGPLTIPSPKKVVYLAGLGTITAVEAIERPIAVVVAAGGYLAHRRHSATT